MKSQNTESIEGVESSKELWNKKGSHNLSTISTDSIVTETNCVKRDIDHKTGKKMINQYVLIKEIGRGFHGKVKLAYDVQECSYWVFSYLYSIIYKVNEKAIKIVDKFPKKRFHTGLSLADRFAMASAAQQGSPSNPYMDKIKREIAILKKCNHPHVVKLKEVIDDAISQKIYLVLEYVDGGEIHWSDNNHPPKPLLGIEETRRIFRDLICGVYYLHQQQVIHRDLKPANLLQTHNHRVKISDFGVSIFNMNDQATEMELAKAAGSPAFLAPEICGYSDELQNIPINPYAIDIWAMGITLYCLVFGQVPFTGNTEFEVFHAINHKPLEFPDYIPITLDLKDLFNGILNKNPLLRMNLEQIRHHSWVIHNMSSKEYHEWSHYPYKSVDISKDEIDGALTLYGRIKQGIKAMSARLGFNKRAASMPSIPVSSTVSDAFLKSKSRKASFQSSSSPPVVAPYLPQHIQDQADLIQEIKNEQKNIENTSFIDTSLYEDSSSLEHSNYNSEDENVQKELDRIREWAKDLNDQD